MTPLSPGFLVAVPQLGDPNFTRSVVLLLDHNEKGAFGVVVNRPGRLSLVDVAKSQQAPAHRSLGSSTVFNGGPVSPERGIVLHGRDDLPERYQILEGLYVSTSKESLRVLLGAPDPFRLCLGYAGWDAGQLEQEIRDGAWLATEAHVRHVLATAPADAWAAVIRGMGIDPAMLGSSGGVMH